MANDDNSENDSKGSELEKKLSIAELRIKHADVFNNPAITKIAYWRDPLDAISAKSEKPFSEAEYAARALANAPKMVELYKKANEYRGNDI